MKSMSDKQNDYNMNEIDAIAEALERKDNEPPKVEEPRQTSPEDTEWVAKTDKEKSVFEALSWLKSVCIGVLVGVLLVVFVIQRNDVYGPSMEPTLHNGDKIFAEKVSTYFANYKRGDVVILDGEGMEGYDHEEFLIKRIVGMPGDTIKIDNGVVYIKEAGKDTFYELDESYLVPGTKTTISGAGYINGYGEMTLGATQYYCLGDNRLVSNDSRTLGPFDEGRIKGVALIRVYPFSKFGTID